VITSVVLAAGQSRRMGTPKMLLPWEKTTIIRHIVSVLLQSEVDEIGVVTGGAHEAVEQALDGLPIRTVFNAHFEQNEMVDSLRIGLEQADSRSAAALVVLGDQPQIQLKVVDLLLNVHAECQSLLVVPSYDKKRGHPWIVDRSLWPEIKFLLPPCNLRDFLQDHHDLIHYVDVFTDTILQDLDTPEDYARHFPGA
jgi:molybdenum cofactor cytidylyltransferase